MRQVTDEERARWLDKAEFVGRGVEVLTAIVYKDRQLGDKLESSLSNSDTRIACLWPFFFKFLRDADWLGVWDHFCLWLATERIGIELGGGVTEVDPEDELDELVEWYQDSEGDE